MTGDYSKNINLFNLYTNSFLKDVSKESELEKNLTLKINHSLRVSKIAEKIALREGFNDNNKNLAKICGLFHDIGRFEQYTRFKTFSDENSCDHGDLGEKVLFKEFKKHFPPDDFEVIRISTLFHNKKEIPQSIEDKYKKFLKLTRDADKTDIYKILCEHYKSENTNKKLTLDLIEDNKINNKLVKEILNKELLNKQELVSVNDFKLLQISWIFDINYKSTYHMIIENNYLQEIIKTLPDTKDIEIIQNFTLEYMDSKINKTANYA